MTDSYFYNNYGIDLYGEYNLYRQMNKKGITGGMAGWDKDGNVISQEPHDYLEMNNYNMEDEGIISSNVVKNLENDNDTETTNIFKNEYKDLLSMLDVEQDEDKRQKIINILDNFDKKDYVKENLGYYIKGLNLAIDDRLGKSMPSNTLLNDEGKKDMRKEMMKKSLDNIRNDYKEIYDYLKKNDSIFREEIDNENDNLKSVGQDAYNTANTNLINDEKMKTINSLIRDLSNSKNKYDTEQAMRRLKDMDINIDKIMNDYMLEKDNNDELTLYNFVNNNKKYLNDVMRGERSENNIFNSDDPKKNKDIILKNFANDRADIVSTKNDKAYSSALFSKVKDKIEKLFKEYGKDVNISDDELQIIKNQIKNHFPFDGVSINNVYELKSRNNDTYDDNVNSPYRMTKLGSGKSYHKVNIDNEPYIISYIYTPKYDKDNNGNIVLDDLYLSVEIFEGEWNSRYKDRNYITDKNGNKLTPAISTLRNWRARDIIWADINKNGIKMLAPLKKGYVVEQTNSAGETDYYVDSSKLNNKGTINFNYKDGYTATPRHLEKYDYKNNDWLSRYTKDVKDSFIKEETKSKKKGKKGKKKGKGITGGMVNYNNKGELVEQRVDKFGNIDNYDFEEDDIKRNIINNKDLEDEDKEYLLETSYKDILSLLSKETNEEKRKKLNESKEYIEQQDKSIYTFLNDKDDLKENIEEETKDIMDENQELYNDATPQIFKTEKGIQKFYKIIDKIDKEDDDDKLKDLIQKLKDNNIDYGNIENGYIQWLNKYGYKNKSLLDYVKFDIKKIIDTNRGNISEDITFDIENPKDNADILLRNYTDDRTPIYNTKSDKAYNKNFFKNLYEKINDRLENNDEKINYGKIDNDLKKRIKEEIKKYYPFDGISDKNVYELKSRDKDVYNKTEYSTYNTSKLGFGSSSINFNHNGNNFILEIKYEPSFNKTKYGELYLTQIEAIPTLRLNKGYDKKPIISDINGDNEISNINTLSKGNRKIIWADINKNGSIFLSPLDEKKYINTEDLKYEVKSKTGNIRNIKEKKIKVNNKYMYEGDNYKKYKFNYDIGEITTPKQTKKYDIKNNKEWKNRYKNE